MTRTRRIGGRHAIAAALLLAACGGGGDGEVEPAATTPVTADDAAGAIEDDDIDVAEDDDLDDVDAAAPTIADSIVIDPPADFPADFPTVDGMIFTLDLSEGSCCHLIGAVEDRAFADVLADWEAAATANGWSFMQEDGLDGEFHYWLISGPGWTGDLNVVRTTDTLSGFELTLTPGG